MPEKLPKGNLNFDELVEKTDGLSGADIKTCVLIAASKAVKSTPQQVEQNFLIDAIEQIKISSKYVGKNPDQNVEIETKEVSIQDLPEEVQRKIIDKNSN